MVKKKKAKKKTSAVKKKNAVIRDGTVKNKKKAQRKKPVKKKPARTRAKQIVKKALATRKPVSGFDYATLFSSIAAASPVEDPHRPMVIHSTYLAEFTCIKRGKIVRGIATVIAMNPPHARRIFIKKMENEQAADPSSKALDQNNGITLGNFLKLDYRQHSVHLFALVPPEKEAS